MDLLEKEGFWGGIVGDAVSILRKKAIKKKKLKADNVIAYLFTREQVESVLDVLKGENINIWMEDGIFCLSRYKKEDFC